MNEDLALLKAAAAQTCGPGTSTEELDRRNEAQAMHAYAELVMHCAGVAARLTQQPCSGLTNQHI